MKKFFALMGGIILLFLSVFAQAGTASVRKYAVALRETIIYAEPNTSSEALFVVPQGERMLILEDQLAWLKVKTSSGIVGFVRASSVKVEIERIIRQATENPPGIKAQPPAGPPSGAKTTISKKHSRLPLYIAGGLAVAGATAYVLFRKGGLLNRGTTTLKINSHPSQAKVYIDDEEKCETPCTVEKVSPGKHTIKVVRELYGEWSKEMELKGYQEYNIEATLSPYGYDFDFCFGGPGKALGQFYYPSDLTLDRDGNIYVTDNFNSRIQKFDSRGNFIMSLYTATPGGIKLNPDGIVYSPHNDRIYVTFDNDSYGALNWYDVGLNLIGSRYLGVHSGFLGVDSSGNIYAPNSWVGKILKIDPEGNKIDEWTLDPGYYPIEAAPSPNGNVYISADWDKILIYSSSGSFVGEFPKDIIEPRGIIVDRMGHVYVVAVFERKIYKFMPDGEEILSFGDSGDFSVPLGIAVFENGDLAIVDNDKHHVCIWRLSRNTVSSASAKISVKRKKGSQRFSPYGKNRKGGEIISSSKHFLPRKIRK